MPPLTARSAAAAAALLLCHPQIIIAKTAPFHSTFFNPTQIRRPGHRILSFINQVFGLIKSCVGGKNSSTTNAGWKRQKKERKK